ncbi:hypothetical protein ATCV1_z848R [Acanthocystis turfacea chlorella virus 1]|uniref:Uncharacterized protein z848R n=1 Tax=Chlorovirus heliozoae TaxID=322019 RepID=A7KAA8_9PHYC|nr:hypothetical protein ATCV1_z848R [Acanthocystis turfacea chlorella virus 1]ABT16982.1 hypothetical protein ATCV1_z848R [Acanthocystis turfacea chlorella virus 1]
MHQRHTMLMHFLKLTKHFVICPRIRCALRGMFFVCIYATRCIGPYLVLQPLQRDDAPAVFRFPHAPSAGCSPLDGGPRKRPRCPRRYPGSGHGPWQNPADDCCGRCQPGEDADHCANQYRAPVGLRIREIHRRDTVRGRCYHVKPGADHQGDARAPRRGDFPEQRVRKHAQPPVSGLRV